MTWYPSPIQPQDPVIASQTPKPPVRYMRDSFLGTGQNSYVQPPAQDQAMWQSLVNVQPITNGILNQRWGYINFAGLANATRTQDRLYNFQSDNLSIRSLLVASPAGIQAFNENGTVYNTNVFTPFSMSNVIRSVTSRDYQYFCNGNNTLDTVTHRSGDSLKWNGSSTDGVTNIGILATDITPNSTSGAGSSGVIGPDTGTTAVNGTAATPPNPWTNPSGIFTNSIATAARVTLSETIQVVQNNPPMGPPYYTTQYSNIKTSSNKLQTTKYFNSANGDSVAGLQVSLQYSVGGSVPSGFYRSAWITLQLIKNGFVVGSAKSSTLTIDGTTHTANFGGATDTWGTSFAPVDLVQDNFGVQISVFCQFSVNPTVSGATTQALSAQVLCPYVTMTAYMGGGAGTSSTSGDGVGINSAVASGDIDLTIGRIYYLVANTATVGHFSDLSMASASTGPSNDSEFNLLLATYNDPQVDTKYVLATADGGDPSVLYQTSVLVPGLTVSSWAIDGANQVTFTGVYTGDPPSTGATVVVGGLNAGDYMNGETLTVTSTTPTTLVANFTHATDSATEIGIVGNNSFAIPNDVFFVVDNTPEVELVLNQPMVYTDAFGNEFGLTLNTPPPAGNLVVKHQGRLWMAGVPNAAHSVFYSKSVSELTLPNGFIAGKYEEAWPGSNYFDVSDGAEIVTGLLSDGSVLYIGTQNHVRRVLGNSPTNFQQPQIVHPETGVMNQEVWRLVFMQGAPAGAIWMTPDFRVMQSDFNTYIDIGAPIQDILNGLQSSAMSLAHATFFGDGEYDLYVLAVPYNQATYCDLLLIFDLRHRQWFMWQSTRGSISMLYNLTQTGVPQLLFVHLGDSSLYLYDANTTTDNGDAVSVSATTTWMHLGEPTRRKILNEIQVFGNTTMTLDIKGANNFAEFSAPQTVVYDRALRQNPFGTWTLYLTGDKSRHRYYQFKFKANNGQVPFLGSYSILTMPLDDL